MRRVERMSMDPFRQESEDDEECEEGGDGPAPHDRRRWHAFEAIRAPKRADQTEGHAARSVSVIFRRKNEQLRHAARDAREEPKREIAGALKNRFSNGAEEQQETKIGEQMIQINVHENGGEQAPPLAGEDGFAFHADGEQHRIHRIFGDGVIRKHL